MALYMVGFVTYGATLAFYAAVFPRLARNTPHARELRHKQQAGEISTEEYEVEESLEKNRISNISNVCSYLGFLSLPSGLCVEGPQHLRIHCRALSGLDSATAFGRTSNGQQLRFGIVRCENHCMDFPPFLTSPLPESTHTGSSLGSGGVSPLLIGTVSKNLNCCLVIFQQPRPGPPMPGGSSYLTIGWKQVLCLDDIHGARSNTPRSGQP